MISRDRYFLELWVIPALLIFFLVGVIISASLAIWGCTSTLKTGEQTFHFQVEVPVLERTIERGTPQYWVDRAWDALEKTNEDGESDN